MGGVTSHSRLQPLALPTDDDWLPFVEQRCGGGLDRARAAVEQLKHQTPRDGLACLQLWNEANIALGDAMALATLLPQVHPDDRVRQRAEHYEQKAQQLVTDLGLDRALYDVFAAIEPTTLDAAARRVLEHTIRDFRRSGVDRDDATRERLRALAERETQCSQEFGKNIRDDVRSIRITADRLAGLPPDFIDAHPADADGLVTITTDYPDVVPFRTFATDAEARRAITIEFLNRAWPINDSVLGELLGLRHEHAQLLGYQDWADYDAEVKMVGSGAAIADFIDEVADKAAESARRDYAILLDRRRRDDPDAATLDAADSQYYAELVRRERFAVDAQQVRAYLDFTKVRAGLLEVTGRLFGLSYRQVSDAAVWHADVTCYDVMLDGEPLGRIYLDLHPREGKYKHAAQFELVSGIGGRALPEGVLVCNFSRGLMEHDDVVTLFHEFGHLVHHLLAGRQRWQPFSGVATEWDFVEAPSQMLEEWAWDPEILRSFATDKAGEPIPADLVARMRRAQDFGKGYQARAQMFYASLSYRLHHAPVADLTGAVRHCQDTYDLFDYIQGTHFHAAFGHLDGYSSAYYTYMWSLVIAKDLFSAFNAAELFETGTAHRYRDAVLAAGGSADAADLVEAFLGRPYNAEAFSAWLDR